MRAALSRRHVHGLRFQPPATGGVHRIAGGVAQEPADAECRHAAARVAIAPPENPRLHVTLHPPDETGRKRMRDSDESSGADTTLLALQFTGTGLPCDLDLYIILA